MACCDSNPKTSWWGPWPRRRSRRSARAHGEFLADPDLIARAGERIADGQSAGWAWQQTIEAAAAGLEALDDPLLAGRATDLRDVGTRVLRRLAGTVEEAPELPEEPVLLLAEDLTPSDAAALDPARILGFCGGMAGDPLGVVELSVSIPSIAAIKARLRNVSLRDAQRLARRALACDSAEAVRALVKGGE